MPLDPAVVHTAPFRVSHDTPFRKRDPLLSEERPPFESVLLPEVGSNGNEELSSHSSHDRVRAAFRVVAILGVGAVLVLSLLPGGHEPVRTGHPTAEHFAAYAALGLALRAGFGRALWILGALVGLAGSLEVAQAFVPGRHASVADALVSAAGACLGTAAGSRLVRFLESRSGHPPASPEVTELVVARPPARRQGRTTSRTEMMLGTGDIELLSRPRRERRGWPLPRERRASASRSCSV